MNMDNIEKWNFLINELTDTEINWVSNFYDKSIVADLMYLDGLVQSRDGIPSEGDVVRLENILSKIRKAVKDDQ